MWSNIWQIVSLVLYIANILLVIYACIFLFFNKQDTVKTISWMIVIILLPYIGIILYIFLGRNFRKEKMFNRKGAGDLQIKKLISNKMIDSIKDGEHLPPDIIVYRKLIVQNLKSSQSILTTNSEADIYFTGGEALDAMYQAMESAEAHIHLQSFIIEDDSTGNRFKDLMIKKAKEGVEVRVMFDGFGSRALSKGFIKELKDANVEILNFSPFRWIFPKLIVNYRNHRKILVVDGKIGFLGGVNIADRYYNGGDFPEWRDTHLKLIGESVYSLQASFLLDRFFILNKNLRKRNKYYPDFNISTPEEEAISSKIYRAQIIPSGPDSDWSGIMCYFTAITQAKHNIYIIPPILSPPPPSSTP